MSSSPESCLGFKLLSGIKLKGGISCVKKSCVKKSCVEILLVVQMLAQFVYKDNSTDNFVGRLPTKFTPIAKTPWCRPKNPAPLIENASFVVSLEATSGFHFLHGTSQHLRISSH